MHYLAFLIFLVVQQWKYLWGTPWGPGYAIEGWLSAYDREYYARTVARFDVEYVRLPGFFMSPEYIIR